MSASHRVEFGADPGWSTRPAPPVGLADLLGAARGPGGGDPALGQQLGALLDRLPGRDRLPDPYAQAAATEALAALATPPGALGDLGALSVRLAGIAGRCPPPVPVRPAVIVAAGDHGVHARGVSPWPQTISATVAGLLAQGRAGASAMAAVAGVRTVVLDVGLATPVDTHPRLVPARVVDGTRDAAAGDALDADEVVRALLIGARVADALAADGADLLVTGDVGIGNTTTSAALVAAATRADAGPLTGRGSGIDDAMLARKRQVVEHLAERARDRAPLGQLAAVGGTEHAALVGVLLAAAGRRIPVLLDGVVTAAAAVVAVGLAPPVAGVLVAGHRSPEPAAAEALGWLGLRPLLDLGLRLGEGSGALLALPTVVSAARVLHDVATLAEVLDPGA